MIGNKILHYFYEDVSSEAIVEISGFKIQSERQAATFIDFLSFQLKKACPQLLITIDDVSCPAFFLFSFFPKAHLLHLSVYAVLEQHVLAACRSGSMEMCTATILLFTSENYQSIESLVRSPSFISKFVNRYRLCVRYLITPRPKIARNRHLQCLLKQLGPFSQRSLYVPKLHVSGTLPIELCCPVTNQSLISLT